MKTTLISVFGLSLCFCIMAQEAATPPSAPPTPVPTPVPARVQVQFSVFVWPTEGILLEDASIAPIPRTFYRTERGNVPVRLIRNAATPLHAYSGELPLVLYDIEEIWTPPPEDAPPETEPTVAYRPIPVIRADFPRSWNRVLLIVFPDRKADDGTLLTLPLPYDMERLRPGMARIYNGSAHTLVLEFPDTEHMVILPPYTPLNFDPGTLSDSAFTRVFVYRRNERGDVDMVHTSRLFMDQETTNYYFLYPQGRRRIRLLRVAGHVGDTPGILP